MDPGTAFMLGSAALKIGGALFGGGAARKAAKANAAAALSAFDLQLDDLAAREIEERAAAAQAVSMARREALSASSSTKVSAAEAGVAGGSVDAMLNDIIRAQGEAVDSIQQNLEMTEDQIHRQRRGAAADYIARKNQVQAPNAFATALRIGGAALGAVTSIAGNSPTTSTVGSTPSYAPGRNPNNLPGQ